VSVLSDVTNTVLARFTVGSAPRGMAYDPARDEVFVANYFSDNVSVISDVTNRVVGSVTVGQNPVSVAWDGELGEVFVANYLDNNVTVLSDRTNGLVATVPMPGHPESLVYDGGTGEVLVTSSLETNDVSVIADAQNSVVATVPVGTGPGALAFDSVSGRSYVTNYLQGTVSVLFLSRTYAVNFSESGLPEGTRWFLNVTANAPVNTTGLVAELNLTNGTYRYYLGSSNRTYEGGRQGIEFVVDGGVPALSATFVKTTFRVAIIETGLALGTPWTVLVDSIQQSSTQSTIVFLEDNGSHFFRVSNIGGYSSAHNAGSFGVYGAPVVVYVSFLLFVGYPSPFAFEPVDYLLLGIDIAVFVLGTIAVRSLRRRAREPPGSELFRENPFPTEGPAPTAGEFPRAGN